MGDGLKQVWGLNDPKGPPSTAQADQFKASYQSVLSAINAALQYTVVNAEKPKHGEKASERDGLNSTYQAVIVKIDPNNPAAAQGAIDNALAQANTAKQAIAAFKADVEQDVANWRAQEPTFDHAISMIAELEAWGHKLAETLRAVVKKIQEQVNNKILKPSLQALVELMQKLQPIYDDYLKQKAAKEKYDPAFAGLQPKLPTTCQYQKLKDKAQEIVTLQGQMEAQVKEKIYVEALPLETQLETKVAEYQAKLEELEKQKKDYEESLAKLQPNLTNAVSAPQHEKLADKRKEIDAGKTEMESAAQSEEFEQAHQKAEDLSTKVYAYKAAVEELEKQKKAYEDALAALELKLAKISSEPQYKKLADNRSTIDSAKKEMETTAQSEEFEQATKQCGEVSTLADDYAKAAEEIDKQKKAYEDALAALQLKLQPVTQSKHEKLKSLEEEIPKLQSEIEKTAQDEDYEAALKQVADLSTKVDEYNKAVEDLEKKKAEYEKALAAAQHDLADATQSKAKAADLESIQADLKKLQADMEAKAKAEEYEDAQKVLVDLQAKAKEFVAAIEKKKQEFEATKKALVPKLDDCMVTAHDFKPLQAQKQELLTFQEAMESAATSQDFDSAKDIAADLERKADAYLAAVKKAQEKYDQLGETISKKLDAADAVTRGDVAKAVAKGLKPDEVAHLPTAVRNRLLEEVQRGGLTDDAKKACKVLFSQPYMDPEFEKLDMKHRREMIEKMKSDPDFKHARENWDTLTQAERVAIMQKAVDIQADSYGIPKTTIATYSKNDPTDYGYYKHSDGKLYVNSNDAALKNGGFDEAIDTAVHENGHRQQNTMADNLSPPPDPPKIKPGDPEYNQAKAFKLNDPVRGFYVQPQPKGAKPTVNTGKEYFTQPMENHSRTTGTAVQNAGIGT